MACLSAFTQTFPKVSRFAQISGVGQHCWTTMDFSTEKWASANGSRAASSVWQRYGTSLAVLFSAGPGLVNGCCLAQTSQLGALLLSCALSCQAALQSAIVTELGQRKHAAPLWTLLNYRHASFYIPYSCLFYGSNSVSVGADPRAQGWGVIIRVQSVCSVNLPSINKGT